MRDEILAAIEPILFDSPSHGAAMRERLEAEFARAVQKQYAVAVHSGTIGLFLALRACGVGPGDEVITVGNSDISTTAAISHCGAVPVLCDVTLDDYAINPELVESLITTRTKALLPVDLYGHPADVCRLREVADRHGLKLVEDATLAMGAQDYGRPVGTFADIAVYSFAPFKPMGSVSNGGMLTTNDEAVAERARLLCEYGHSPHRPAGGGPYQSHIIEGYNVPLDTLQAALVLVKLPYLADWTRKRREVAMTYAEGLRGSAVALPLFRVESYPTFRAYTVRVPHQQQIYEGMRAAGVEVVLHYAPPIYRQPVYASGIRGADLLPVSDQLAAELLCLPVSIELTPEDIQYAIETLLSLVAVTPRAE